MEAIREAIKKSKRGRPSAAAGPIPPPSSKRQFKSSVKYRTRNTGQLSRTHLESERIVAFDGEDPESRPYDMLRTRILQKLRFSNQQVIGVTSPRAQCGKTVTSTNLAFSLARQPDQIVFLVDLDLRRPSISKCLGFQTELDVHDVLNGDADLADAFVVPSLGGTGLRILACSETVVDPSLIFHSDRINNLMKSMKQAVGSGVIVIDLPPVLAADDVISLLPMIDSFLLVAEAGQTTPFEIEECERLLSDAASIDIVLNKADVTEPAYY